jgi:hypothetical protein
MSHHNVFKSPSLKSTKQKMLALKLIFHPAKGRLPWHVRTKIAMGSSCRLGVASAAAEHTGQTRTANV